MSKKDLKQEELERKTLDLEEKWKRALADYQNLERRAREERSALVKSASESLLVKLLPAFDELERAADHIQDEGLNLALRHLLEILKSEGLTRIQTLGEAFNPQEMEALETVEGKKGDQVSKEFRAGYKLKDKVIRVAQVQVQRKNPEKEAQEKAKEELQKGDYM